MKRLESNREETRTEGAADAVCRTLSAGYVCAKSRRFTSGYCRLAAPRPIRNFLTARTQLPRCFGLETKLRPELTYPRTADRVRYHSKVDRVLQIAIRVGEVNRVKDIEDIEAKLEV